MKKRRFTQSLVLIFSFCFHLILGQVNDIHFRQISPAGGFVLKGIYKITQDDLGYIWIGTKSGLIKYDSQNTTWYKPSLNDTLSLPSEIINDIYIDNKNNVWIATNYGLSIFDRKIDGFKNIKYGYEDESKCSQFIESILKTADGKLLIADSNHFGYLDISKQHFIRIGVDLIRKPTKIYKDNYNQIWIGTTNGDIFKFDPILMNVKKIITGDGQRVNTIYADNDKIWVGYDASGVKMFDLNAKLLKHYNVIHSKNKTHIIDNVRVIKKDTYGRLWLGTYEGLFMDDGSQIVWFNPDDHPGLPHNSIYEIFEDQQGGIWIGTWSGGIALIHHSDNYFKTYRHNTTSNSISNNTVSSFLQVNNDELLIGTEVGGLNSFNLTTEKFHTIDISNNDDIKNIKSLTKDKFGGIWVGTYKNGLWYQAADSTKFKLFDEGKEDGHHISSRSVYSMCPVDSGIWIVAYPSDLNFYDYKSKKIRFCFQNKEDNIEKMKLSVQCIFADSNSNLWIEATQGLYKIHSSSGEITKIIAPNCFTNSNKNNIVHYLWEHSSGDIWMITNHEGILIFHPKTNKFEPFDANGLLKGKDVYGIIEDKKKSIWITSNDGLIVYSSKTNTYRHFDYSDGLQSNLFSPQAIYKDKKGIFYFGGTNGFTKIDSDVLKLNSRKPLTIISNITTKNNKIIYPTYSDNLKINKIVLYPKETTFRINFFADNYLIPKKNNYKYRLINHDNNWVEARNNGSALFSSLTNGYYIFEVKACNNDGIWNDTPTQIQLEIKKIWYRTTFAYFVYSILFITLLYYIGRFYFDRIKLEKAIQIEKNQRKNEDEIHEMKLRFFTNISHEFRTPLTLISWPLKKIIAAKNISDEQREELEVVANNSNRLLQLINQIVDLRKLESVKSKLSISQFDLIKLINEMQQGFKSLAKTKKINFLLKTSSPTMVIEADLEKINIIIYNLLSNAYKNSSYNGQIKIILSNELSKDYNTYTNSISFGEIVCDDYITIAIEDTGSGIDGEDMLTIFNRFEQGKKTSKADSEKKGSGIGLSICKEYTLLHHGKIITQSTTREGARFTIILPREQKAQNLLFESHQQYNNLTRHNITPVQIKVDKELDKLSQILIVEDNVELSTFICTFLKKYYQVVLASNGEEALSILQKSSIDLIVSDVMMPKMDGLEFCNIVKAQIETCHIPVILLTALSSSDDLIAGLDKGADAYLTKPFDENILIKQIENILNLRKKIRDDFSKKFISQKTVEVSNLDNFFLNRVRIVVEKNISEENFGMEILAKELMISRSQLHRKIKALSGFSTSDFVNLVRIKKAIELIKINNYSFSEVFYRVGFSSQAYFTKCFKKTYNMTPKEYFSKIK